MPRPIPSWQTCPQAQIVTHEGDQVYCLVPRDQETSTTVQTPTPDAENGYQGEVGDTLYTDTQGRPVILIGNVSDVIPNLQVTLGGGQTAQNSSTTLPWASVTTPSPCPPPQGL